MKHRNFDLIKLWLECIKDKDKRWGWFVCLIPCLPFMLAVDLYELGKHVSKNRMKVRL